MLGCDTGTYIVYANAGTGTYSLLMLGCHTGTGPFSHAVYVNAGRGGIVIYSSGLVLDL